MALTANSSNIQIIKDDASHVVARLRFFQATAGQQSDELAVNAASVAWRTTVLTLDDDDRVQDHFIVGDQIVGGTSGAVGYVTNWIPNTSLTVTVESGTFQAETITNQRNAQTATVNAVTQPSRLLHITAAEYSVSTGAMAALEYANSTSKYAACVVSGQGYLGKNHLAAPLKNDIPNSDGNIYVSTAGIGANGGYTIVIEVRKSDGYAAKPVY